LRGGTHFHSVTDKEATNKANRQATKESGTTTFRTMSHGNRGNHQKGDNKSKREKSHDMFLMSVILMTFEPLSRVIYYSPVISVLPRMAMMDARMAMMFFI
jgi:hypothetical protein